MASLLEQLTAANADVARLKGIETSFNTLTAAIPGGADGVASLNAALAQIPGGAGGISAFVAEHASFRADVTRLQGELTAAQGEATRVRGEMETLQNGFDERVALRAAEIVSTTGNQPPAAADKPGATTSVDGKTAKTRTYAEHWSHYATLSADEKNAYYRENSVAMNANS